MRRNVRNPSSVKWMSKYVREGGENEYAGIDDDDVDDDDRDNHNMRVCVWLATDYVPGSGILVKHLRTWTV